MKKDYPNKALLKVINYLGGKQVTLAKLCKVRPQVITWWLDNHIPAERVLFVHSLSHEVVTLHQLRPDIYKPSKEDQLNE